jgi:alkylated DNA nucleotide flippase Atl1
MNYREKYQKARQAGYSDDEIIDYLSQKDPSFGEKMEKAKSFGYEPEEIMAYFNAPHKQEETEEEPEQEPGVVESVSDFGKQAVQGAGTGFLGTYGDILDFLGLQSKEISKPEQEKYSREFKILQKMEKGEVPSYGEFMDLSGDEPVPRFSRLPSSQDVEELGTQLGLVSEPKTAAGRYGKRIGKLSGSSAAFGGGAGLVKAPVIAGAAGQTLEELGAPPWAQAAAEILATLKFSPKNPTSISSKSPEVEEVIQNLRKAGYSEKDITLAKSALEERKILKKYASLTPEAENAINQGVKNSEELLKKEIKKGLPGYAEGGLPYLEKQASNVYRTMEDLAETVSITNKEPIKKAIQGAVDYLEKYPLLKEQKDFIEFMKDGLAKLDNAKTAEFFTGFYRNLGKAGHWGTPTQKEHILGLIKEGIKETFAKSGPEAARFGQVFESTNEAWKHWLKARDLMKTLEKANTVEGTNFKKVASILNEPENHKLAVKVLGPEQVNNIKSITKGAPAIESLLKQISKPDKNIQSFKILEGFRSLLSGDYRPLAALVGFDAAKKVSTKILIDPKYQNMMKRVITAAINKSPQNAAILAQEMLTNQAKEQEESDQELEE